MNIQWKYASPVSIDTIEAIAKENAIQLPDELKVMILKGNNGYPTKKHFDSEESGGHVFKTLLSYNKNDIETVHSAIKILKEAGSTLYPIANDPAGNFICLDGGEVVLWNHETGITDFVAHNVADFFDKLY